MYTLDPRRKMSAVMVTTAPTACPRQPTKSAPNLAINAGKRKNTCMRNNNPTLQQRPTNAVLVAIQVAAAP